MQRSRGAIAVVFLALPVLLLGACTDGGSEGSGDADGSSTSTSSTTTTTLAQDHAPEGAVAAGAPVPSPGCEGEARTDVVTTFRETVDVGGEERWFLLSTPTLPEDHAPIPLVVDLHGLIEGADIHALMTHLGQLGQQEGFAVAFPQGSGQPVHWDIAAGAENADLAMVDAMVDQIGRERCIDESRTYAAGLSNGAMMASLLACERDDRFAAIGAVDGLTVTDVCAAERPVPVVSFHGTADPILRFNGGVGDLKPLLGTGTATSTTTTEYDLDGPGYPAAAAAWAARNGCEDHTDTTIGTEVIRRVYDCPAGADVEFYIVTGGGHSWPGSEFSRSVESVVGHTTFEVVASDVLWQFFRRFRLPQ
jgi:polyhydroxybutyrate depolymerase